MFFTSFVTLIILCDVAVVSVQYVMIGLTSFISFGTMVTLRGVDVLHLIRYFDNSV